MDSRKSTWEPVQEFSSAFERAVSTPAGWQAAASSSTSTVWWRGTQLPSSFTQDSDLDFPDQPRRRAVTEPARPSDRQTFFHALDAVDSALPFSSEKATDFQANLALCAVSLVGGCVFPILVDGSKTAIASGPNGVQVVRLPYSPLSVLRAEAAFNVGLGIIAIAIRRSPGGFAPLLSGELHREMLPLTLAYCLGDIAAFYAIGTGGGPLYIAVSGSRLLFAAGVSRCLLSRRQTPMQWMLLFLISIATASYAILNAEQHVKDGQADGAFRATVGFCCAVAKAFLCGSAAVLTEMRYKQRDIWHANTLLKGQSLVAAIALTALHGVVAPEQVPICGSASAETSEWCIDRWGWDAWTWAVLAGEIGSGWLSVSLLKRMSAVAKFICKTATAPSLYVLYSMTGFRGFKFHVGSFLSVAIIALGILAYTGSSYLDEFWSWRCLNRRPKEETQWAKEYGSFLGRRV